MTRAMIATHALFVQLVECQLERVYMEYTYAIPLAKTRRIRTLRLSEV